MKIFLKIDCHMQWQFLIFRKLNYKYNENSHLHQGQNKDEKKVTSKPTSVFRMVTMFQQFDNK